MAHPRLFIAFDSPPEVKSKAGEIQDRLRQANADVSWERPEKLHCTIKFLGDTPSDLVTSIGEALEEIGRVNPPFSVQYRGTGVFPDRRDPRILWLGIENPDGRLNSLFRSIDSAMVGFGFKPKTANFTPT